MVAIKSEKNWLVFVVLFFALLVYRYVYSGVLGEEDLARVAVGILYSAKSGFDAAREMHYGLSFSYGYYWFIYTFLPHALYAQSDALIKFINYSGFFSSVAVLAAGGLLLSRLYSPLAAVISVILFGFSPMFMELSTSGHPLLPATALLFLAGNAMLGMEQRQSSLARVLLTAVSCALIFMSLSVRAETALALPWLVVATSLSDTGRNKLTAFVVRLAIAAFAFIVFLYFQSMFLDPHKSSGGTLYSFLHTFYRIDKIAKGIAIFAIAFGIVSTVVALAASLIRFTAAKRYVLHASLLIIPTLILWLPTPQPSRHFFFAFFGLALLAGGVLPHLFQTKQRAVLAAIGVVLANQAVIELLYPTVVARYEWNYPKIGDRRSTFHVPLGFFPLNHRANDEMFMTLRSEGRRVAAMTDPQVIVFGDQLQYMLLALLDSSEQVRISQEPGRIDSYVVTRGDQRFHLITKYLNWPEDTAATYLAQHDVASARVYVQPYTISKYDVSLRHMPVSAIQQ